MMGKYENLKMQSITHYEYQTMLVHLGEQLASVLRGPHQDRHKEAVGALEATWDCDLTARSWLTAAGEKLGVDTSSCVGLYPARDGKIQMLNKAARKNIRSHLRRAGYTPDAIKYGISYAVARGACDARDGYIFALSRIRYDDLALEAGALVSVEDGFGTR